MSSYAPFGKYVLRIPQKPLKSGFSLLKDEMMILDVVDDQIFIEGLDLASPSTFKALTKMTISPQLLETLQKYYVRASTRATPFGLFSGCSVGNFANEAYEIKNYSFFKKSRLDFSIELRLFTKMQNLIIDNNKFKFMPNSSYYYVFDEFRFVECEFQKSLRKYSVEKILPNPILKKLIGYCHSGRNFKEIKTFLSKIIPVEFNSSLSEIEKFVRELIENQILIPCELPKVTNSHPLTDILKGDTSSLDALELMKEIRNLYSLLDQLDLNIENNQPIKNELRACLDGLNVLTDKDSIIYTDLFFQFDENQLNKEVVTSVQNGIEVLKKLTHNFPNRYLENFKKEFNRKYKGKEISLSNLFDSEFGLTFHRSKYAEFAFIDQFAIETKLAKAGTEASIIVEFFKAKLKELDLTNSNTLRLTKKDLEQLGVEDEIEFSSTFYAMIEMYNKDIFIASIAGPTASRLIARFSNQNIDIESLLTEITSFEKNFHQNKILAEIVHIPQDRIANVLRSKVSREYEIVYLSGSSKDIEHQIFARDIMVSIDENRIVLKSKKLNKEIVPILSNAYNYELSELPIYNFLCQVQEHYSSALGFEWNACFDDVPFLPRIQFENLILSKARWIVSCREISDNEISLWRKKRGIPQYVQIMEHDNYLLLNLDQHRSQSILRRYAKRKTKVTLVEFLFNETNGIKIDGDVYANELIIPFYREE